MATTARDTGLDAFRGMTVLLMVIVNLQGSHDAAYALIRHAEWNGLTLADVVFPWFILIVGLSIPLAEGRTTLAGVARRAAVLFALGVGLAWLIRPSFAFEDVRWMGVLQRIGIVYLAAALVARAAPGWRTAALLALGILVAHTAVLLLVTAPGEAAPSLAKGAGLSAWLDRALLPGHLFRSGYDPEGVLSTFPAIATALIGVAVMRWRRGGATNVQTWMLVAALLLAARGAVHLVPLNKGLWTASFVAVTAGSGLAVWLLLNRLARDHARWLALPVLAGQTALTLYVIHMLLLAVIVRKVDGARLWERMFDALAATGLAPGAASLVFSVIAGALCLAPLGWLNRRGWLIRA